MTSFLDIIQMPEFREYTLKRLINVSKNHHYSFPNSFLILFRYRALSTYAIDDILKEQITITSIGEFNDLFDGAIHRYGSDAEQEAAAEKKWTEMEELFIKARMPQDESIRKNICNLLRKPFFESVFLLWFK